MREETVISNPISIQSRWTICLQWVGFSLLGWLFIFLISLLIPSNVDEFVSDSAYMIIWALVILTQGAVIAAFQWLVIRRFFSGAARWVAVSSGGLMLGQMVALPLKLWDLYLGGSHFQLDEILYGAIVGLLLGTAQWLVVRTWVDHAHWWIVGSVVGWSLGMTIGELIPLDWNSPIAGIVYRIITDGIPMVVSGITFVLLLNNAFLKRPPMTNQRAG